MANRRRVVRVVLLLLALTGCSGRPQPPAQPASASGVAGGGAVSGSFGGTDRAWLEITIAMNQELLPLLELAPDRSADPDVATLATRVREVTETELTTLRTLHDRAGLPSENPHVGMPMPGMVTTEQVAEAARLTGAAFDRRLLGHVKAHLEQGLSLARSEEKAGVEPQTRALAAAVITARTEALAALPGKP